MKPRINVYLSEPVAAQLAVAAQRPGATKAAIIEAALAHFLNADRDIEEPSVDRRLNAIHQNLEQLHQDVRIVSETVALQARFLLAVTPPLAAADQPNACALGLARFDEFAAQVARRVHRGTSLIKETIEQVNSTDPEHVAAESVKQKALTRSTCPGLKYSATTAAGNKRQTPRSAGEPQCKREPDLRAEQTSLGISGFFLRPCRATAGQGGRGFRQNWLLILRAFLPFVAAYYLSFLFRNINATIAGPLSYEFGLGADDLGLLTSIYFLTFAAAQIPVGILLDRYGPRQIQSVMLLALAAGAALFAVSDNFLLLLLGRALIGLGASAALMAGLKAVVLWFPTKQAPLLNGLMVMLAALGGATATLPAEYLLVSVGWRGLFELLAIASLGCALAIFIVVPKATCSLAAAKETNIGVGMIYTDPRFWRLAPLSATCIGTAWALQGLWAAQWFSDVEGLDRSGLLRNLFTMALAASAGALVLGVAAQKLRRYGIGPRALLGLVAIVFFVAQLAVILRVPLPSSAPWMIIAAVGAATVLSCAILAEFFPKELSGRANAALNVLHIGCAFVVQFLIGFVVQHWTPQDGHYPEIAYQTAFAANLSVQLVAWFWFIASVPLAHQSGADRKGGP
ncbi:MFS transporter [Bradyrhizobium sp. BWA-3-5]|uniref:MFS transporter n=1 Tax=Bradyrhizobium sp. BWA-3-5 TaxID=3080013 RepID=UPI00293F0237|nr:MFS transporter [Bradyrhizobium sp. BWA-3-5]WOH63678.1 MFS transporter [Bradyrhizobium sp. BWA-3-5]